MVADTVVCLHSGKLASQLGVLHPQSSHLTALHFHVGQEAVILILQILDRVGLTLVFRNGWQKQSINVNCERHGISRLTFGKNFPLGCLGTTLLGHQISQILKKLLHFCPSLSLGKLVAHT